MVGAEIIVILFTLSQGPCFSSILCIDNTICMYVYFTGKSINILYSTTQSYICIILHKMRHIQHTQAYLHAVESPYLNCSPYIIHLVFHYKNITNKSNKCIYIAFLHKYFKLILITVIYKAGYFATYLLVNSCSDII